MSRIILLFPVGIGLRSKMVEHFCPVAQEASLTQRFSPLLKFRNMEKPSGSLKCFSFLVLRFQKLKR